MKSNPRLSIWYVSALRRCNFKCSYCVSGQPGIEDNDEWHTPEDRDRHYQIIDWIKNLPYQIKLRVGTTGEPFVSKDYLESMAKLSHSENLEYLEILTNGSFTTKQFNNFITTANPKKLTFWMTYHPTEISLDKFINAAICARDAGVFVVVHALVFPDTIESSRALKEAAEKNNLTLHVGLGLNYNNAYPDKDFIPIHSVPHTATDLLELNVSFPDEVYKTAKTPLGSPCSAGHDYLYINFSGNVYPCRSYARFMPFLSIGSALNKNFVPELREKTYAPCMLKHQCVCTEDHQNLEVAKKCYTLTQPTFIPHSKKDFV